jgi:outer membrane receptor protein involved in Fe transport
MAMIRLLFAAAITIALASPLRAQPATVSGTVVDESGSVVPGATVLLTAPEVRRMTTSGARGEYTFDNVAAGAYDVVASLVGFSQATAPIVVESGSVAVPPLRLAVSERNEVVVVSASRTDSPLIDAPATVSVLGADVLESTPAQNYGDLLRSVPGVNAIQLSARDVNLTNRQATSTLTNSQLVLLDGRSIYLDFFGLVLWDFVPNNLADIKQIEIVRGPASAVWGANAVTGAVNIITKSPREAVGTTVSFNAGAFSRQAGSGEGRGLGAIFGANATVALAPSDRWSYRVSAGYFNSDPFPRPVGQIPLVPDPRISGATVGGGTYPIDSAGAFGSAFENIGTSQPKFDARVDQEIAGGRITYAGGVAGTAGIIHTGIGPFDIQPGSYLGYAKVNYSRNAWRINAFTNLSDVEAPNLLLPDPLTGRPLQLNFKTETYDIEISDSIIAGPRQLLTFGGNARRNNFDITIAPNAKNRNEFSAYVQDEIFFDQVRFTLGARLDKFGNLSDPVFSPRLAAVFKPADAQAIRVSFNRAFRSPSVINNFIDINIVSPIDLSRLAPALPPALRPLVATPFPLVVRAVGSELPIGTHEQAELKESSMTAYEVAYTGTFLDNTTVGIAFYVNDWNDEINFTQLSPTLDPYTSASPPPGWRLPPSVLDTMASLGILLPRTAFTYLNLGPLRQKGIEVSLDQRVNGSASVFANYSWQAEPTVLDDSTPYPAAELALPPNHRFNVGFNAAGDRLLGGASVNYSSDAFWSDVLTSPYHGFTDAYTLVNGSFGVRWMGGKVTTTIKANNILNQSVQQHVFGDIIKTSVLGEVRLSY